jgi:hypothetical protein
MALKRQFDLMRHRRNGKGEYVPELAGHLYIVPKRKAKSDKTLKPLVIIRTMLPEYYIDSKDLERFAVNILKALNSKKLK